MEKLAGKSNFTNKSSVHTIQIFKVNIKADTVYDKSQYGKC